MCLNALQCAWYHLRIGITSYLKISSTEGPLNRNIRLSGPSQTFLPLGPKLGHYFWPLVLWRFPGTWVVLIIMQFMGYVTFMMPPCPQPFDYTLVYPPPLLLSIPSSPSLVSMTSARLLGGVVLPLHAHSYYRCRHPLEYKQSMACKLGRHLSSCARHR